jgi:hypothetical protein
MNLLSMSLDRGTRSVVYLLIVIDAFGKCLIKGLAYCSSERRDNK